MSELTYPPFPNGAYGGDGIGPVYVDGNIPEWSASASPYYTIGQAVKHKGLVYKLNYNWDGTTVGSPSNQVDSNNVRVWTLQSVGNNSTIGIRVKYTNADSTFYYVASQDGFTSLKPGWNYWHNVTSAHYLVFEGTFYNNQTSSGTGKNLLTLGSTFEVSSLKTNFSNIYNLDSISFNSENGIDSKMFGFVTSSCGLGSTSEGRTNPQGVFKYYGNFKKNTNLTNIGTLYYEAPITYTLTTKDWVMSPEWDETETTPLHINYTFTDPDGNETTVDETIQLKMKFGAETFLGRTYSGAYRVYVKDGYISELRYELDSVSPDMRTM